MTFDLPGLVYTVCRGTPVRNVLFFSSDSIMAALTPAGLDGAVTVGGGRDERPAAVGGFTFTASTQTSGHRSDLGVSQEEV